MFIKRLVKFFSWLITFGYLTPGFSQQQQRVLDNFENLVVDSVSHQIYYEQRLYRNPAIGLLELKQTLNSPRSVEFVPFFQGIPVAGYRLDSTFQTTLLTPKQRQAIYRTVPYGPRQYKIDFRLHPEITTLFGNKTDPFQTKTNVLLQTQLYLTRGLVLNFGVLFPIVNNYDNQPMNIRPAPIFLNQFLALDRRNYLSVSVGSFYNNQYGANLQYRFADLTKSWSFGVESSLTGQYYFPAKGIYYEPLRKIMVMADIAYRVMSKDLTLKLSGGQFLYQDQGFRFDVIRQFYSVEVGLYATKTSLGSTAGFNFAIPIPPGKIAQSQRARLRTSEEFRWEYTYNGEANIGTRYRVGYQLDALLRQYHTSYLSHQIQSR